MGYPTSVHNQISDAVSQSNLCVVAEVPALAMGVMNQALGHSISILFESVTAAQREQNTLSQAASNQGVMQIYTVDTMADATETEEMELEADHPESL